MLEPVIIRPQYSELQAIPGLNHCQCRQHLWLTSDTRKHWEMGHFDRLVNPGDPDYPYKPWIGPEPIEAP
jgi:hypothetical protein